jgi:hypothetical protein
MSLLRVDQPGLVEARDVVAGCLAETLTTNVQPATIVREFAEYVDAIAGVRRAVERIYGLVFHDAALEARDLIERPNVEFLANLIRPPE